MDVSKGRTRERRETVDHAGDNEDAWDSPGTRLEEEYPEQRPQVCICREYDSKSTGEHMQAPGQWE